MKAPSVFLNSFKNLLLGNHLNAIGFQYRILPRPVWTLSVFIMHMKEKMKKGEKMDAEAVRAHLTDALFSLRYTND